jgi:uncharacterized membrane protein YdjX (TVP38/TMEM64 family)
MKSQQGKKSLKDNKYLKRLVIVLFVGLVTVTLFMLRPNTSWLLNFIQKYKNLSIVISLSVYALLGATFISSEPLTLLLITLYGPTLTVLIAAVGNTLAALVEYFIGGNIVDVAEFEKRKGRLPFHLGDLPVQSPLFIILVRTLPGFGPKFVSLACGIYKVPVSTYAWATFVSNLIGMAVFVVGGYGLLKLL